MSKKLGAGDKGRGGLSRRDFFKAGAAAGVGAAALGAPAVALAQGAGSSTANITWDYEVDVLVLGGGCMGLPSAIRARDLGNEVMIIDQNFDLGGKMLHSGSLVSLGGGDPLQLRDLAGEFDKEGFIKVGKLHTDEELTEDTDHLFRDMTDWSIVDSSANAPYRYNERELHRAWADNCFDTRNFLIDNYVRFTRISGTHGNGGMTRARRASAFLMLGDKTDIKAGTVTREDAGIANVSSSHFAPRTMSDVSATVAPGAVTNGAALSRGLEFSAREKGVKIMLHRHFDDLIRDEATGRIIGVTASYSPRMQPGTSTPMQSYWQNGNIDEQRETIHIRARKAVIMGTGGHVGNPQVRSMFYPAMREPAWGPSAQALIGDRAADASAMKAGLKVGANLAGMQQNLSYGATAHIPTRLATRDAYTDMLPGHPTFPFRGSTGFPANANTFEHIIAVNQVGKRFFNDMNLMRGNQAGTAFPGGNNVPARGVDIVQADWRNSSRDHIRGMYNRHAGLDAALQINEGSTGPDFFSGPLWAIFDAGAAERAELKLEFPWVADNGYFFSADTLEELQAKINAGHKYQRVPMTHLADTVARWNGFVDAGEDTDFGRGPDAPMHKIEQPKFYAASIVVVWHDSYGGLRINGKCQVVDMEGAPIPGLYAGCEASGGGNQHGLGRGLVHAYIAGSNAHEEPAT
ncbi:FAD-dependent oxidoreductase [Phaeovulum sp.]|uniref:FAD-dependent oxidoreductase n=1 Tax=Phaeovulum sp. TaxID=2934796 RepID=UPI0027320042|nr:FAD-dependent oxidoreductase [Phaeovulum sp.]MDP1667572.1 FAD-binding protein [Phaeovulum sp.]MDZ4120089.1 FAD-binding protein [Phaeovulum sp.]